MKTMTPQQNLLRTIKRIFVVILIFVINFISILHAQLIPVLEPAEGFHIDGDLQANTPNTNVGDWVEGPSGSGGFIFYNNGTPLNPLRSKLVVDPYDGNDLIFQGSKFNDNPALWSWTSGKASAKNDINNMMYHLAVDNNNETWIIMGSDRFSNNGTSYIDFEFFQNTVTRNPISGFSSMGPHGGRTINDLVISMEYSNGGSSANLRFYLWKPVGSGYDYVEQVIPPAIAYGRSNDVSVDIPFGAFGAHSYLPYTFVEAGVNISDLFGTIDPCLGISIKTIIVKTKASASSTANLGDFVEPIQVTLNFGTATISYLGGDNLCPNGTVSAEINGVTGGTFSALPSGLNINSTTGEINMSASTPGTYIITYSFLTSGCPRTTTTTVTIVEKPEPPISAVSDLTILCSNHTGSITLTATGGSGVTLKWFKGSCNGTLVGTGNNLNITAPTQTTTYYAAWENNCGISSCTEVTVSVLPELTFNSTISANISYYNAADGEITITANGGNGIYTYSLIGSSPQVSNVFSNLASGNYDIIVYDSHGCIATGNISIPNAIQIIANNDAGSANGMSGGTAITNVLSNDLLDGNSFNPANVVLSFVSSSNPNITLVGSAVEVAQGTPAGIYTLIYQICETANQTNCDQADVVITVTAASIVAANDNISGINGYTGATTVINVLNNDLLNGNFVNPAYITLAETIPEPNNYLTLNNDGTVDLAPSTPMGTYTLTYEICEVMNPGNCDEAVVNVTVIPAAILAVDDAVTGINGTTGDNNVINVFSNDLLNNMTIIPSEVTLSLITPNTNLTLNPDGSVDVAPFTPGGTYTLTYQICEVLNPTNCSQAFVSVQVFPTSDISIIKSQINPSNLPVGSDNNLIYVNPSVITAGTKIYYYLRVDNFGPNNSINALIEDNMPSGISNTEYSLNFGNSWFAWNGTRFLTEFLYPGVNSILLRGDLASNAYGTLTNTATIYSPITFDPYLSNNESSVITNINQSADLILSKQVINGPIIIGGDIIYQINIFNNGPSDASEVVIEDIIDPNIISGIEYSIDNGLTWLSPWTGSINIGTLADNATFSLRIKGTILDLSPNPNIDPIPNTATVSSLVQDAVPGNNTETIYTPLNEEADVSILKTGPSSVIAGEFITYTITLTNNSNTFNSVNVHIHDVIDQNIVTNLEYSDDGGINWSVWTDNYDAGTLTPLQSVTILIRGKVLSSITGSISNTAVLETDTPDPDQSNNSSSTITNVIVVADLDIFKIQIDPSILPLDSAAIYGNPLDYVITPTTITAGEDIYYVLFYGNSGPSDATNVIIEDTLPGYITNIESSRCQANYGNWSSPANLGTIISGGRCIIVIRGTVSNNAIGDLVNTTTISNEDAIFDPDLSNNSSTFTTPLISQADLSIQKTVNNNTPYVSDTIIFTISVTNNGPYSATNISVTDILPNGYTYISHNTASGTYNNLNGLWTIGDINFPSSVSLDIEVKINIPLPSINYQNLATITNLDQFDPDLSNNQDEEITYPINVIIATDDTGSTNGMSGGTAVSNVLANDLINGSILNPANVNLSFINSTHPNISLVSADVIVASGTPAGTYTLTYEICEVLNPTNCDQADVIITINAAPISANDDNGSVNGMTGGTAVTNVLSNDLLNGVAVNPIDINLSFISSTHLNISLMGADVVIAPGIPAGSYTLTYEICEVLNPTNCDQADVIVTINAADIDAKDDNGSANGMTGGTAITNVLSNDILNGFAVNLVDINLSFISSTHPNISLVGTDVVVAPGTPAGSYTLIYKICEVLNPTNCDQANIIVAVTEAAIVANNDLASGINGYTGSSNVLTIFDNDSLNGVILNPAYVNMTVLLSDPNNYITLNPNGSVEVSASTPAGTYYITYQICEILNPLNCDNALITVLVQPAVIYADDDIAIGINGFTGATNVLNVFDNDELNYAPVIPSEVNLAEIIPDLNGYLTLNLDGSVDVAPGTPSGTYTLIYEICEILNPTNCYDATVYVTVELALIVATDDNFSSNPIDCENGGIAGNLLDNDLLNSAPINANDINISLINNSGIVGASIDAYGNLIIPAGVAVGTYELTYEICDVINPTNCDNAKIIVEINDTEDPEIICATDVVLYNDFGSCDASNVSINAPQIEDNCGTMSVIGVRSDNLLLNDPYPLGLTTITWTVTDFGNNTATCEQTITVIDNEIPTIECAVPDISYNTDLGVCSYTVTTTALDPISTGDNCSVTSVVNDFNGTATLQGAEFQLGTTTVIWTVTDGSGNIATCSYDIVVADNEIPTIECAVPDVSYNTDLGVCSYTVTTTTLDPISTGDNCSVTSVVNDFNGTSTLQGAVFQSGTTTVIWTVTDGSGNIATCSYDIVVADNEIPTIECANDIISCTDNIVLIQPLINDNCGIASVTNDAPTLFPVGQTTVVTWTAIDVNGNMSQCTQSVSVSLLTATATYTPQLTCYNGSDGEIEITASGGIGTLTYASNGSQPQNSNIFNNLTAGIYEISIIDENSCSLTLTDIVIENNEPMTVHVEQIFDVCYSVAQGQVIVNVLGGISPYMYSIDSGMTFQSSNFFTGVNADTIHVVVMDANGCISEIIYYPIEKIKTIEFNVDLISQNQCFGIKDAIISINTIQGGIPPYLYSVNGSVPSSDSIFTIGAGYHNIIVYDYSGCFVENTIFIPSAEPMNVELASLVEADCKKHGGSIEVYTTGGLAPYSYKWSNGADSQMLYDLQTGTYTVTVTDFKGCQISSIYDIPTKLIPEELVLNNAFSPNGDGINDVWVIENLELYPDNELVILNRWGNEIYSVKSYQNNWNGSNLSEGTYFYILKVKLCNEYLIFKDFVTIIR